MNSYVIRIFAPRALFLPELCLKKLEVLVAYCIYDWRVPSLLHPTETFCGDLEWRVPNPPSRVIDKKLPICCGTSKQRESRRLNDELVAHLKSH